MRSALKRQLSVRMVRFMRLIQLTDPDSHDPDFFIDILKKEGQSIVMPQAPRRLWVQVIGLEDDLTFFSIFSTFPVAGVENLGVNPQFERAGTTGGSGVSFDRAEVTDVFDIADFTELTTFSIALATGDFKLAFTVFACIRVDAFGRRCAMTPKGPEWQPLGKAKGERLIVVRPVEEKGVGLATMAEDGAFQYLAWPDYPQGEPPRRWRDGGTIDAWLEARPPRVHGTGQRDSAAESRVGKAKQQQPKATRRSAATRRETPLRRSFRRGVRLAILARILLRRFFYNAQLTFDAGQPKILSTSDA